MIRFPQSYQQPVSDWRQKLDTLRRAKKHVESYRQMMTPYERHLAGEEVQSYREREYSAIAGGILGEFEVSLKNLKDCAVLRERAQTKELARWDSGRLSNEINILQALVGMAKQSGGENQHPGSARVSDRLQEIYSEARRSGDIYKQRAAAEVVKSLDPFSFERDSRVDISGLARRANADLQALRMTEDLQAATKAEQQALDTLQEKHGELAEVGAEIDGEPWGAWTHNSALAKAYRRVRVDPQGRVSILEKDDPEVTGVDFSRLIPVDQE